MYTPLKFMNQIETMVSIIGQPRLKSRANDLAVAAAEAFWSKNRGERFVKSCLEWNRLKHKMRGVEAFSKEIDSYKNFFTMSTGLVQESDIDFLYHLHMYLVRKEWRMNKRVYKVDKEISKQLAEMKNPKEIPMKALAFLPSKCFYIDYDGECPFCEDINGSFVTYDIYDGKILWRLSHLCDRQKVLCLYTDFGIQLDAGSIQNLESIVDTVDTSDLQKDKRTITLEDGHKIRMSDGECVRFFINFCLYLYSANNDVEYTERTKQIYRKAPTVKNTLREVEEFGVGFRNGKRISQSQKKVRYITVGDKVVTDVKRRYASNYRSAHWHHYWINDPENEGKKKLILKWVEGTFVHGNTEDMPVVVQRVTK